MMKNAKVLALIFVLLISFVSCGKNEKADLDTALSILDTQTDTYYSLGDTKTKFDKAFGAPDIKADGSYAEYHCPEATITVMFDESGRIYSIALHENDRFIYPGYEWPIMEEDIPEYALEDRMLYPSIAYYWYMDKDGGIITDAEAKAGASFHDEYAPDDAVYMTILWRSDEKTESLESVEGYIYGIAVFELIKDES